MSYGDILSQNDAWFRMVMTKFGLKSLSKGIATHVTLDNNDRRQETITGKGTSHDTNFTLFQPVLTNEVFPSLQSRPT